MGTAIGERLLVYGGNHIILTVVWQFDEVVEVGMAIVQ